MDTKQKVEQVRTGTLASFPDGKLAWPLDHFLKEIGMSRSTWYEQQRAGEAPATFKIGTRVMVTPQAVERWIERRASEQAVEKASPAIDKSRDEKIFAYLKGKDQVSTAELLEQALGMAPGAWGLGDQQSIGRVMKRLGVWSRKRAAHGYVYSRKAGSA